MLRHLLIRRGKAEGAVKEEGKKRRGRKNNVLDDDVSDDGKHHENQRQRTPKTICCLFLWLAPVAHAEQVFAVLASKLLAHPRVTMIGQQHAFSKMRFVTVLMFVASLERLTKEGNAEGDKKLTFGSAELTRAT